MSSLSSSDDDDDDEQQQRRVVARKESLSGMGFDGIFDERKDDESDVSFGLVIGFGDALMGCRRTCSVTALLAIAWRSVAIATLR